MALATAGSDSTVLDAPDVPDAGLRRLWAGTRARIWSADTLVIAVFILGGAFVTGRLWLHPDGMLISPNDEAMFEWMLGSAARSVTHLENPLFSTQANAPDGINLMAGTSVLGLGIPLTPVTLLFGTHVSYLVATVICLSGTATSWYLVMRRALVSSRVAAFLGAGFCGFAPGIISQATGHLHLIAQVLIAPIVLAVCRLGQPGRVVRGGVVLGLLVAYQLFLAEELLLFAALALGVFTVAYALVNRGEARRRARGFLAGLGIAAGTAGALLAYPLWFQFFGPQHYRGLPFAADSYIMEVLSFSSYSRQSLGGDEVWPGYVAPNPTEENAFFGLALLALTVVIVVWLWHRPAVKALAMTAVVFAALSFGTTVKLDGQLTAVPGPYRLLSRGPLLDLAVPARFPLVVAVVIGALVALSVDRVWAAASVPGVPVRLLWTGAVVAAMLPTAPLPLRVYPELALPTFVSGGQWRQYVPPGRTLVAVPPLHGEGSILGMFWSARTTDEMAVTGGFFNGPTTPTDDTARFGAFDRPTSVLLGRVADTGKVPMISEQDRRQAIADLRYWRGAVVVLGAVPQERALHRTVDALLGPGQRIGGAWVWDVRSRVGT
jgi:hypothetical protein